MAQFYTDFSEYSTTAALRNAFPSGWSASGLNISKLVDSGRSFMRLSASSSGHQGVYWPVVGSASGTVEILTRARTSSTSGTRWRIVLHSNLNTPGGSATGYLGEIGPSGAVRTRLLNNNLSTVLHTESHPITINAWYWMRLRREGTQLRLKFWREGESEPASWNLISTNTNLSGGYVGVGIHSSTGYSDFSFLSVGTGGDSAPFSTTNTPPTITSGPTVSYGGGTQITPTTPATVTFTATDVEDSSLSWRLWTSSWSLNGSTSSGSPTTITVPWNTPGMGDGTHYPLLTVSDDSLSTHVDVVLVRASPPPAPGNVSVSAGYVSWDAVSGATRYDVRRIRSGQTTWTTTQNVTSPWLHTPRQPGTTYSYQVRAASSAGQSAWSSGVSETTASAGEFRVVFTPNDNLSTSTNELRYEIRTGATGTGTLLDSGTTTAGEITSSNLISTGSVSFVDGENTLYLRIVDGALNVRDVAFTVFYDAPFIEYEREFIVQVHTAAAMNRRATLTREFHLAVLVLASMLYTPLRERIFRATTNAVASIRRGIQRTFTALARDVARALPSSSRFRSFSSTTSANLSFSKAMTLARRFVTTTTHNVYTLREATLARLHRSTTAAQIVASRTAARYRTFKTDGRVVVWTRQRRTLTRQFASRIRNRARYTMYTTSITVLQFLARTRAALHYNRFFNLSRVYTATTQYRTRLSRHTGAVKHASTAARTTLRRHYDRSHRVQQQAAAIVSRYSQRYRTYLAQTSGIIWFRANIEVLLSFISRTSSNLLMTRRLTRRLRSDTRAALLVTRTLARRLRATTTARVYGLRLLVLRFRARVQNVARGILANEIRRVFTATTRYVLRMGRHMTRTQRATTRAIVVSSSFLRRVRQWFQVHIFNRVFETSVHLDNERQEYAVVFSPNEYTLTLDTARNEYAIVFDGLEYSVRLDTDDVERPL